MLLKRQQHKTKILEKASLLQFLPVPRCCYDSRKIRVLCLWGQLWES